jgi:glycosyltransferase involved in cell wall biosynthesis
MRLLIVSIYFPPRLGGIESHVDTLARGLARRGHEVEVVTLRTGPGDALRETPEPRLGITRVRSAGPNLAGWLLGGAAMFGPALRRTRWADVVHAHTMQSSPAGMGSARAGGVPLLLTIHESHFLRYAKKVLLRPFVRWSISGARLNLGTSEEICDLATRLAPHVPCRAVVNGVDVDHFQRVAPRLPRRSADEVVLLAARRLVIKNGVEYLVRAMPHIRRELPTAHLYLVGDGPLRASLQNLAGEFGVAGLITFLGPVPNHDMPGHYSSADIVIMPSLIEATSVAALEAMACEVPVAASRVGGLPEIVSEENGTLFESANPEALARAVVALYRAGDRAERGRRGRELVAGKWSLARLLDEHERYYRLIRTGLRGKALDRALLEAAE